MSLNYKLCKTKETWNGVALFRTKIKDGIFYRNGPLVSDNVKLELCENSLIDENSLIVCDAKISDFLFKLENSSVTNTIIAVSLIPNDFHCDSWSVEMHSTKIVDSVVDCFSFRTNKSKINGLHATCEEIKLNDSIISDVDMSGTLNSLDCVNCKNSEIKNGVLLSSLKDFCMFCLNSKLENVHIVGSTIENSEIKNCFIESSKIKGCKLLNPLKLKDVKFYDIKSMFYFWDYIEEVLPMSLDFISGAYFPIIKGLTLRKTDTLCFILSKKTYCFICRDSDSGLIRRHYEVNDDEYGYFFGKTQENALDFSKKNLDEKDFNVLSSFAQFDDACFDNSVDFALMFFACFENMEELKNDLAECFLIDIFHAEIKKDEERLDAIKKERMCANG